MTDNNFYDKLAEGEYVDKLYAKTITCMIFNDEKPVQIIRIDGINSSKFIILKKKNSGSEKVTSTSFWIDKTDSVFLTAWFSQRYPNCEFEQFQSKKAVT